MLCLPARCDRTIVVLLSLTFASTLLHADDLVFDIDPLRSELVNILFVAPLGVDAVPQGEGADRSNYSGTITVRVDDPLDPTSIQFLSSNAVASVSGSWLPETGGGVEPSELGDAEPANYGMFADDGAGGFIFVAVRNTNFIVTSEEPIPVDNGFFGLDDCSNNNPLPQCLLFHTDTGTYDFNIAAPNTLGELADSQDFEEDPVDAINQEGNATYVVGENGVTTLTIPILLEYNNDLADFFFEGVLVATHGVPTGIPGDANGDGRVDAADLNAVGINWQMGDKTLADGDFDGDGFVGVADLNILGVNWQMGVPAAASVPEPSTCSLLCLALLMGLCRRRYVATMPAAISAATAANAS